MFSCVSCRPWWGKHQSVFCNDSRNFLIAAIYVYAAGMTCRYQCRYTDISIVEVQSLLAKNLPNWPSHSLVSEGVLRCQTPTWKKTAHCNIWYYPGSQHCVTWMDAKSLLTTLFQLTCCRWRWRWRWRSSSMRRPKQCGKNNWTGSPRSARNRQYVPHSHSSLTSTC